MIVALDTNLLLRFVLNDDETQALAAKRAIETADAFFVSSIVFCELAWVMLRGYRRSRIEIGEAIERLLRLAGMRCDRPVVEAGLAAIRAGADFADGAIVAEGARAGAKRFLSFDRSAVEMLGALGIDAATPGV